MPRYEAKITKKHLDQMMRGTMLVFAPTGKTDGKGLSLGDFVGKSVNHVRGLGNLANMTGYFVPGGRYAGGGRLSAGMATEAALWISKAVRGDHTRYSGPPIDTTLSERYYQWKKMSGSKYAGKPILNLTGALADSIQALRQPGKSGWAVGINSRATTTNPMTGQTVKVTQYAAAHDFGSGKMPQRPIISGAMLNWLESVGGLEKWAKFFRNMLLRSHLDAVANPSITKDIMGKAERAGSAADNIDPLASVANIANQSATYIKRTKSQLEKAGDALQKIADSMGADPDPTTVAYIRKAVPKYFKEVSAGLDSKEVNAIIDSLITGKVPKISDLF